MSKYDFMMQVAEQLKTRSELSGATVTCDVCVKNNDTEKHGIIMTVGVYAVATGENQRAEIQALVMRTLTARKDLDQIHGFFYDEKENLVTVDVIPDLSVKDEPALCGELTRELGALLPGKTVLVTVDHNYSE